MKPQQLKMAFNGLNPDFKPSLLEIRETILNTAICLITYDKELRTMFTNAINKMNEEEKKSTQIKQDA